MRPKLPRTPVSTPAIASSTTAVRLVDALNEYGWTRLPGEAFFHEVLAIRLDIE
jgi:hypothetical protein